MTLKHSSFWLPYLTWRSNEPSCIV